MAMRRTPRRSDRATLRGASDDYWSLSARPLHSLVLLLPLVIAYEVMALTYLTEWSSGIQRTVLAHRLLSSFLELFGVIGLMLPGPLMLLVLLAWHIFSKDRWTLRPLVLVGMVLESILWALPLVVFAALLQRAEAAAALAAGTDLHTLSTGARVAISLGAGLYEELLFRLIAIALLHAIVKDLLGQSESIARVVAIVVSSLLFAIYHPITGPAGIEWWKLIFYFTAGVFFASLYLARGFGVVVATHAAYDIIVLVLLHRP